MGPSGFITFRTGNRIMIRRLVGLAAAILAAVAAPSARAEDRPNVVFILADDLGWTDLGCQGSRYYETPNIDKLAAQGMRLTYGYTCGPNCQPTRAAMMSGQYGPRTGVYTVGGTDRFDTTARPLVPVENVTQLPVEKVTIAESLKGAGYATGLFGKWHLGNDQEHHPLAQGFDEAIVSMGRHFDFQTNPKVDAPAGAYLADFLTDKALDFIDRRKDGPFYLALHHFGAHAPWEAKEEGIARFKGKAPAGGHHDPVYAAMIASVDESVGRVLAKLDELGLAEKTLVIFTSDNGGVGGYEAAGVAKAKSVTDNAPLRGGKGMLYEGGVRVPYLFRWAGKIKPGATSDEPINTVDLYPTLLELAGAKAPEGYPLDGESYLGLLLGKESDRGPRALYWHFPGYLGAGQGTWRTTPAGAIQVGHLKLLEFFEDGHIELYDVKEDVGQRRDLAREQPEKARELHERLIAWRESIGAPMPAPRGEAKAAAEPAKKKKKARAKT